MRKPIRALAVAVAAAGATIGAMVAIPAASTAASLPPPIITPRPTFTLHLYPDLTIGRAGGCTWYRGAEGDVWLNPLIEAYATGFGIPAHTSFNMVSNYDKHTAGGTLTPNLAQTWAIDIGPAASLPALGHPVLLTLNVDPTHEVAESNETNNTGYITVDLTGFSSPPGIAETPVPCS
jgi:ABC-type transport system substrate-binding protein